MSEAAVQLRVAGQTYRVVTSAEEQELNRLARTVEDAILGVTPPGRQPSPQALILAAITLAHELEEERAKYRALEERHRRVLASLLERVDHVLGEADELLEDVVPVTVRADNRQTNADQNSQNNPR